MAPLLGTRALNRATLDRQLLLRRSESSVEQAVHHLVGLQAMEQPSSVLVDGFVAATWKILTARGTATLRIRPFRRLTTAETEELAAEGAALLSFAAADAQVHDLTIEAPVPG